MNKKIEETLFFKKINTANSDVYKNRVKSIAIEAERVTRLEILRIEDLIRKEEIHLEYLNDISPADTTSMVPSIEIHEVSEKFHEIMATEKRILKLKSIDLKIAKKVYEENFFPFKD